MSKDAEESIAEPREVMVDEDVAGFSNEKSDSFDGTVEEYLRMRTEDHILEMGKETSRMIEHFRTEADHVRTEIAESIRKKKGNRL